MPPKTPKTAVGADEDVKFLLTIVKQLNVAGAIDWQKVSDELDLPSKGAAAKRFSRLPAKYDITMPSKTASDSPDAEDGDAPKTPKKGKKAAVKKPTASSKKRKTAEAEADDEDDQEVVKDESDD